MAVVVCVARIALGMLVIKNDDAAQKAGMRNRLFAVVKEDQALPYGCGISKGFGG